MLKSRPRKHRNWRKIIICGVLAVALLGGLAVGGRQGYLLYRRNSLIAHANSFLEKKDWRAASIEAHRVLQLHPGDIDASLIMAKIFESIQPDEAIPWRRAILEKRPGDIENVVALSNIELQIGEIGAAQRLLETVKFDGSGNAGYKFAAGQVELAAGNPKQAEEHLLKAVELDPKRNDSQLALAQAQLLLGKPEKRAEARERLLRLSEVKEFKLQALRLVINDMLKNNEIEPALKISDKLVSDLDATFADRLLRLDLSYRLHLPEFETSLHTLQDESLQSNGSILQLLSWLQDRGMVLLAIDWAKGMPRKISSDPRLKLAVAECHMRLQDWDAAKELTSGADWGGYKFLALAFQSRLHRQEGRIAQSQTVWDSAVVEANRSQELLVELERLAESWKWDPETEAVLWKLTERPYPPDWVFLSLQRRFTARADSDALRKLWLRKQEVDPADMVTTNNLALVSLLRGESQDASNKMAADVYLSDKTNPYFVSTYAFSLYRQGKAQEALKALSSLTAEQLQDPSTAVCYVAILVATDDKEKARRILTQIKPDNLLPEEKRLLDQSRNALGMPKT